MHSDELIYKEIGADIAELDLPPTILLHLERLISLYYDFGKGVGIGSERGDSEEQSQKLLLRLTVEKNLSVEAIKCHLETLEPFQYKAIRHQLSQEMPPFKAP